MPKTASPLKPAAHFIGIGGIGISALARWFLAQNWAVTGSDIQNSTLIEELRKEGVIIKIGHNAKNLPKKLEMVIFSPAIKEDNPEIIEARKKGIKPLSYPETVGCLTKVYKTIAIAGSHGKSTTTAMLGLVLIEAGLDPNIIVGTKLKELDNSNFRFGKSKWLLLEADEWQASFLNYFPTLLVITNIDLEHLDFYKNLEAVKKTFLKFINNVQSGGALILNKDDRNIRALTPQIEKITKDKSISIYWYSSKNSLRSKNDFKDKLKKSLNIPGEHNFSNALAVFTLARTVLEIEPKTIYNALNSYKGAWRRMEYKGEFKTRKMSIPIFDDYAHHPTEIRATLQAFREKYHQSPLVVVYQPHQAKRLKNLYSEFIKSFDQADFLIFTPIYEVAGRDKQPSVFTSEKLSRDLLKIYPKRKIYYLSEPKKIKEFLINELGTDLEKKKPIIIMMGAGDIANYTPLLLSK